ncbi:hypothetical protein B0H14DRAFT_2560656 [Mycena olivaceomarginata]|nr:hypothetical protein B0H14DRAFT_2560656 [Mycena olivaceomarginata]
MTNDRTAQRSEIKLKQKRGILIVEAVWKPYGKGRRRPMYTKWVYGRSWAARDRGKDDVGCLPHRAQCTIAVVSTSLDRRYGDTLSTRQSDDRSGQIELPPIPTNWIEYHKQGAQKNQYTSMKWIRSTLRSERAMHNRANQYTMVQSNKRIFEVQKVTYCVASTDEDMTQRGDAVGQCRPSEIQYTSQILSEKTSVGHRYQNKKPKVCSERTKRALSTATAKLQHTNEGRPRTYPKWMD